MAAMARSAPTPCEMELAISSPNVYSRTLCFLFASFAEVSAGSLRWARASRRSRGLNCDGVQAWEAAGAAGASPAPEGISGDAGYVVSVSIGTSYTTHAA